MQFKINPILVATAAEEQFKKTNGNQFQLKFLLRNPSVKDRFDELKLLLKNEKDIEQFKKYLRDALKGYPKYTIRPDLSYISRNNKYESVTNFASLAALVQKSPEGLLNDDELVVFTYRDAKKDINKAIQEKIFKKINFNEKEKEKEESYFIFPTMLQQRYQIRDQVHKDFGVGFYLGLCKEYNPQVQDSSVAKGVKGIQNKESIGTDLNHRLPRFMELKEEWLKRNIKK